MALDLTSLSLSVVDNLDGTVNWTVTGAGAGANVALLRAPLNHQAGGRMAWTQAATATANGAGTAAGVNLNAGGYGFYIWEAIRQPSSTTCDSLSSAVFRPVVDPADPVHLRILDGFVSGIRTLNLNGIGSATNKVFRRWYPTYLKGTDDDTAGSGGGMPMVQVAPYPKETPLGLLTNRDDVGYPVLVAFFAKADPKLDNDMSRNLKWRRQVGAYFRNQQMAGVPEVVMVEWQPDAIIATDWLRDNYLAGAEVFIVRARETRGLIA